MLNLQDISRSSKECSLLVEFGFRLSDGFPRDVPQSYSAVAHFGCERSFLGNALPSVHHLLILWD